MLLDSKVPVLYLIWVEFERLMPITRVGSLAFRKLPQLPSVHVSKGKVQPDFENFDLYSWLALLLGQVANN